ncbi:hypothetical protein [Candidatus Rhodobacter oscarellae]|uniref:hypothetical protein n=1 Tax=Candidatus Rhodobacter oscarellae TaxID=1675527 RepID=UPI000670B943|nr:hypothetical protein [Candidatus Rhodobacter lobularis]
MSEEVKIEKGARLFAELCAKSPSTMEQRLVSIIASEYQGNGIVIPGKHTISGALRQAILTYNTPSYTKNKTFECSVHAFRVGNSEAINAWVQAFVKAKPSSWRLSKVAPVASNEMARWSVSGVGRNGFLSAKSIKRKGALLSLSWQ